MRPSDLFAAFIGSSLTLLLICLIFAQFQTAEVQASRARHAALARSLSLTDLALFTEARYTRHLTQADHHAPFQDHPMALEHFPSGSMVAPPRDWRRFE